MTGKLLTKQHLEFKRRHRGLSECTLVKMPHCWKSHVAAQFSVFSDDSLLDFRPYIPKFPFPFGSQGEVFSLVGIYFLYHNPTISNVFSHKHLCFLFLFEYLPAFSRFPLLLLLI